jgi:hypothetical protein
MSLKKITKPIAKKYDPVRKLSKLAFPDGEVGFFFMRGGVCWPIPVTTARGTEYYGHVLMAGQDVETGIVYIFEEDFFTTPLVSAGKPGLDAFMLRVWREYFARHYFCAGDFRVARKFIAPIEKQSKRFDEKRLAFHFHHLGEFDAERDASVIWEYLSRSMLFMPRGRTFEAVATLKSGAVPISDNVPALALASLLYGLDLAPWKYVDSHL